MEKVHLQALEFALIYAEDHEKSVAFYTRYFNFKSEYRMPDGSCFGKAGDVNLWIGANYKKTKTEADNVRLSVMFRVDSAFRLFEALKERGEQLIQEEPQEMQPGNYWFQFRDPSGNIVDVLGGE